MTPSTTQPAIPPNARCLSCGYSLYKLEVDRCPECGRGFDRRNPESMGIKPVRQPRNLERLRRPHSRFALALPWILCGLILIAPLIPFGLGYAVVFAAVVWILMFFMQVPSMLARNHLAQRGLISADRLVADKRLFLRMMKALGVSVLLIPLVPIYGLVTFLLFQSQLDRLAAYVPASPVSYREFGSWRIGPFVPDAIDRLPHELDIGIIPSDFWDRRHPPWATGTVFILEDDPGYDYDNIGRFHLRGKWYVEYRF
jgi:hypothetical protein